ncbi:DUF2167 domain-containing protein [Fulvivirgaceae bacterium BMA12]|uniref:DUF2167 domain-containing protein n=1 Tax=Agaribacillus aureus TaxID=3051825 RepID=A0ABT8L956_9BACT|nr:DUF2167 domain-containing protein [Fulvivirgaceae bacterium BMA12]
MKKILTAMLMFTTFIALAGDPEPQEESTAYDSTAVADFLDFLAEADSLNNLLQYQKGDIGIGDDLAMLQIPQNFKYLDPKETDKILVEAWGNPPRETLGMILPDSVNPYGFDGWGVIITYQEEGYVDDDDAKEIDFEELLSDMQADIKEANKERMRQGYGSYELMGWAEPPHYDSEQHKLYWALDLKFDEDVDQNTLNYNVRILGRKGILVLNAVSTMDQLSEIHESMDDVMALVDFKEGNRYADFNPDIDKVAAYGVGALIAGKVAAKAGFFKVIGLFLLKGWKIIAIGLVAIGAFLKRVFLGDKREQRDVA